MRVVRDAPLPVVDDRLPRDPRRPGRARRARRPLGHRVRASARLASPRRSLRADCTIVRVRDGDARGSGRPPRSRRRRRGGRASIASFAARRSAAPPSPSARRLLDLARAGPRPACTSARSRPRRGRRPRARSRAARPLPTGARPTQGRGRARGVTSRACACSASSRCGPERARSRPAPAGRARAASGAEAGVVAAGLVHDGAGAGGEAGTVQPGPDALAQALGHEQVGLGVDPLEPPALRGHRVPGEVAAFGEQVTDPIEDPRDGVGAALDPAGRAARSRGAGATSAAPSGRAPPGPRSRGTGGPAAACAGRELLVLRRSASVPGAGARSSSGGRPQHVPQGRGEVAARGRVARVERLGHVDAGQRLERRRAPRQGEPVQLPVGGEHGGARAVGAARRPGVDDDGPAGPASGLYPDDVPAAQPLQRGERRGPRGRGSSGGTAPPRGPRSAGAARRTRVKSPRWQLHRLGVAGERLLLPARLPAPGRRRRGRPGTARTTSRGSPGRGRGPPGRRG